MQLKVNEGLLKRIEKASMDALYDTAMLYIDLVKQEIIDSGGSDTGELVNSISLRKLSDKVQVYSKTVQAVIMEFGRSPLSKRPPVQSLVPWADRKGIVSGKQYDDLSSKDKGIMYVIAKSIGENGIRPRKYFSETFEKNLQKFNQYYIQRFKTYMQ